MRRFTILVASFLPSIALAADRPGVVAHRGVVSEAPENTLPAISKAIEFGCAIVEIDLPYTADGEVVLVHDAGARRGASFRGTRTPSLREAIELARGRIQLSSGPTTRPRTCVRAVVLGFDYIQTDHARQLLETLKTAQPTSSASVPIR